LSEAETNEIGKLVCPHIKDVWCNPQPAAGGFLKGKDISYLLLGYVLYV